MNLEFENLGLHQEIVQTLEKMGFEQPTPIQSAAIPILLNSKDVMGQAQTGTGKTAAFVLPMLQQIQPGIGIVQALILTPTRELAIQVTNEIHRMAQRTPADVMTVYGGQSYTIQIRQLKRGVDIVVGTTGRIMDLMRKKVLDLSSVNYLVLDEADEMLKMGFIEDVETILESVPENRQFALFSATMPKAVRKLADKYLNHPEEIIVNPSKLTVSETEQRFYYVHKDKKLAAMIRLLESENVKNALIFARTKISAQELGDELIKRGYQADALHGDLSQGKREQVMKRFRSHSIKIIVATDVAARGLDIKDVSHVINYDIPENPDDYVHRIGRTGRAGHKGVAITLLTPRQKSRLSQIEAYTKQPIQQYHIPTREQIIEKRDDRFITQLYEKLLSDDLSNERAFINRMIEADINPLDIAAVTLNLARANEGELPEDESIEPSVKNKSSRNARKRLQNKEHKTNSKGNKDKSKNGFSEKGMVRLKMNLGKKNGLHPGEVVGAIANEVGVPGKAIGAIDIYKDHTYVDVSEKHLQRILEASNGKYWLHGKPVKLKKY